MTEAAGADQASGGEARLVFVKDLGTEDGFAALADEHVNDEIVIRELVQNALDAQPDDEADGVVRVDFVSQRVPSAQMPGIADYRGAFARIGEHLRRSPQDRRVSERIAEALDEGAVTCLICRDNGKGLDAVRYKKMLNKGSGGNTDEGSSARGSIGVGHLTAIAASRLRYVLYGGIAADGTRMLGGQCFLATHGDADDGIDDSGRPVARSHHGCLTVEAHADSFIGTDPYPAHDPPDWLLGDLERGTAVCITAHRSLSPRRLDDTQRDPLGAWIAEIVAHHFTVAIEDGLMEVTHENAITGASTAVGGQGTAGTEAFREALERIRLRQRATRGAKELGAGVNAHAAWKVWTEGTSLPPRHDLLDGARIRWKETPGERSRVTLFREGMRISDAVRRLEAKDFSDQVAFHAVVDATGAFGRLVRACETGSHLQVDAGNAPNREGPQLKSALRALAEELRETVPTRNTSTWEPEALRLLRGELDDRSPPQRAKPAPPPIIEDEDESDEGRALEEDPNPNGGEHPGDTNRSRTQARARGRVAGLPASVIPREDGHVRVIWQPKFAARGSNRSTSSGADAMVDIVLLAGNGSDPACDKQVKPAALPCRFADGTDDYAASVVALAEQGVAELEVDVVGVSQDALDALRVEVAVLKPVEAVEEQS